MGVVDLPLILLDELCQRYLAVRYIAQLEKNLSYTDKACLIQIIARKKVMQTYGINKFIIKKLVE